MRRPDQQTKATARFITNSATLYNLICNVLVNLLDR